MAAVFDRKSVQDFEVLTVLTPSLSARFHRDVVIPRSNVLIGAWDELDFLVGNNSVTVQGAAVSAARLRTWGGAEIHVTMGGRGVLSVGVGSSEFWHIELKPEVSKSVGQLVARRPENLCGAGDAFAGGLLMERAFRRSLLSGFSLSHAFPSHVRAALAGCVSALDRIGFGPVTPDDFRVVPLTALVLAKAS